MNGQAKIIIYDQQGKIEVKYTGEMSNGEYHGKGLLILSNGINYQGGFFEGKKHGQGILRHLDVQTNITASQDLVYEYEGQFENDKMHGQGTLRNPSDNFKYVGQFVNNQKHGRGTEM